MIDIIKLLLFIFPAYVANASPVVVGGGTPIDLGKKIGKERIFGDGKTIRGFIGGVACGVITAAIFAKFFPLELFGDQKTQFFSGCLLALGTLIGDLVGSFVKRRVSVKSGKPFFLDQLSFIIVALLFAYPFSPKEFYSIETLAFILVFTYIVHIFTNYMANRAGVKNVPW